MKCLDEGVDVPRSEMAIFCSSTGNPRQFIQRRGRILRKHKDKDFAIIHDFVVVPNISSTSDSYSLEQKLLKNELIRVKDFAQMSLNASDTQLALKEVMQYYKLNLYNNN
jgi:superfamily II DNA or RNA helicase